MGSISFSYNVKPKVIDAFKQEVGFPIVDFNIEKFKAGYDDWQYCVYAAVKNKNSIVCILGLIKYDDYYGACFVKIMGEDECPGYINVSKKVFNKLTPLKESYWKSYAQEWRAKVKKKLNIKKDKPVEGKTYLITGGPNEKCILNGNTWKESEVKS
jgi:hypothetical protein